jgi:O-antigen ligase
MTERLTFNPPGRLRSETPSLGGVEITPPSSDSGEQPVAADPERDEWAFRFLCAFTAVVWIRPQDTIPFVQHLHLAELCAIAALLSLIMGRMGRNLPFTRMTPELAGVLAFGGLILITAPFSIWLGGVIGMFKEVYIKIILIYLLMANVMTSPRRIEKITWLLVLAGGYVASRSMLDYVRGIHIEAGDRLKGAVGGIFGNPNDLALNMVFLLPLTLFVLLRPGSPARRGTAALGAVCMLGAIIASHSRGGTLGLVAMAGVFGLYQLRRRPGLVIGGLLLATIAAPMAPSTYWTRMASIFDKSLDDSGSREARRILLHESFQAFRENPITGVGAGQFKNWNPEGRQQAWHESHDIVLQVAAELGIGGVVILAYLIARGAISVHATRRLLRRARSESGRRSPPGVASRTSAAPLPRLGPHEIQFLDAYSASIAAALAGWFVCALFASVAYNWTFYYLLALAAAPRDILLGRAATLMATARKRRMNAPTRLEVVRA